MFEQFLRSHLERVGESAYVLKTDVAFSSLDRAHVAAIKAANAGKRFLAKPDGLSKNSKSFAEQLLWRRRNHG